MWKTVVGLSNYEIDEYGNIRKLILKKDGSIRSITISQFKADGLSRVTGDLAESAPGYWAVVLRNSSGTRVAKYVHRLVCETFNGAQPCPEKRWVAHRDDRRGNNHYNNLYWATPKENRCDAVRNGRIPEIKAVSGDKHPATKLSSSQISEIRADLRTQKMIAIEYGVSAITVWRIKNNKARVS
ncbi:MAG: HNH endonuclease [Verrucomicrobiaceae bacterium]|nr:MAG: HNH endonuclease [Verrucomicrobiaceae bacterium]